MHCNVILAASQTSCCTLTCYMFFRSKKTPSLELVTQTARNSSFAHTWSALSRHTADLEQVGLPPDAAAHLFEQERVVFVMGRPCHKLLRPPVDHPARHYMQRTQMGQQPLVSIRVAKSVFPCSLIKTKTCAFRRLNMVCADVVVVRSSYLCNGSVADCTRNHAQQLHVLLSPPA